jgi:hypothetical protein
MFSLNPNASCSSHTLSGKRYATTVKGIIHESISSQQNMNTLPYSLYELNLYQSNQIELSSTPEKTNPSEFFRLFLLFEIKILCFHFNHIEIRK